MKRRAVALAFALAPALILSCVDLSSLSGGGSDAGPDGEGPGANGEAGDASAPGDGMISDAADDVVLLPDGAIDCSKCDSKYCGPGGACDPLVFVTTASYPGAIGSGGVSSADGICSLVAAGARLNGSYQAWLSSVTTVGPFGRFARKSRRPYRLRNGKIVAKDFASLGLLLTNPINVTENGAPLSSGLVWTSSTNTGVLVGGGFDCTSWTSSSSSEQGVYGRTDQVGPQWTNDSQASCDALYHLYCFEQQF